MRKVAFLLSLLCLVLLLSGCNNENSSDVNDESKGIATSSNINSDIKKFIIFINDGEYLKAVEHYNEELYGSSKLEVEAANEIVNLLNSLNDEILKGERDESYSQKVVSAVDNVLSDTNIHVENYEALKENIELSIASKAAFLAAKELEELKNYVDAISEYKNVVEIDSNYNDAKNAIERCTDILKSGVFSKISELIEKDGHDRYIEAITQLKELNEKLPGDGEIISKISVYEKTYISEVLAAAESAFVTPSLDYEKSLDIINGALQHYPDNNELSAKKTYYQTFAPVKLASLSQYDKSAEYGIAFLESEKDPLGNIHTDVFRTWSYMYDSAYVVYILDGKYNKLTFTLYGTLPSNNNIVAVSIRDYSQGDYDLSTYLYLNDTLKCNTFPYEVEVDVTGVKMIRVYVEYGIAVSDAILQKTVK